MTWRLGRRPRRDEELEEEIAHDLRLDTEERIEAGVPPSDAEQASRKDFGNILLIKEDARNTWTYGVMVMRFAQVVYDVRHAFRRSVRRPTFTVTALAVLAFGIAANVVVFSIANAVLLKPLTFPDPDRVVIFQTISPTGADVSASPVMYAHWRQQTSVIQDVAAFQNARLADWTNGTTSEQIRVNRVSADYFRLFGASVVRGHTFTDQEDRPGGDAVIVVSHGLWMRRFGGAEAIGQKMDLNGASYTIIAVLDASFRVDDFGHAPDAWVPLQVDAESRTQGHSFSVCARLRPGVTLAHAQEQLRFSTEEFRRDVPNTLPKTSTFSVEPVQEALVGNTRPLFFVLLGAVVFVMLIACSNIANLLLLQAARRRREIAVRAAIGADRRRLVRQLLTESLLLSVSGGAVGLALGWAVMRLLLSMGLSGLPRLNDVTAVSLDWRVIAFTVTLSIATGVLFGLAPALRVSHVDLSAATNADDARSNRGPGRRRVEAALVVLQVSLALVLLIGSALFMRTVFALTRVDAGFDPDQVLALRASLSGPEFAATLRADAIVRRGMAALGAVPGVAIVGAAYGLPLEGGGGLPFEIVGRPLPAGQTYHGGASWQAVSPGYFEALRIPVLRGRDFTASDGQRNPAVMVINDVMARRYWPHEDPLGQHVLPGHGVGPQFQDEPVREIVGIVGSIRENRLDRQPGAEMYEPLAQLPDVANAWVASGSAMAWIVRTTVAPEALARTLPQTLQRATSLPVSDVYSMDEVVLHSLLRQRLSMWLMAGFGVAALLLAAIGVYGLIAHSVEQRTREIGIRLALGAEASRVRRMVIWEGMCLTVVGTVVGLLAALALTRLIAQLLFNVQAWDPSTFVIVPVLVAIVAGLAVWLPARRASRIDPIVALRYE
jgi:putative ABC transport system permease protein